MKILMLMTLLILLTSCLDPPEIADQEQLGTVFSYVTIDGVEYIDIDKSYCTARTYRITKASVGAINKAIKLNIKECDRMTGYAPSEYVTLATFMESLRLYLNDQEIYPYDQD